MLFLYEENLFEMVKVFQSAQRIFSILGISSDKRPFNRTILTFVFTFGAMVCCYIVFLLSIAETFKQYTDNIYLTASTSIITFCLVVVSCKMRVIFKLIDCAESFINESK